MADVLRPIALNEKFTIWLNTEGKPVEKSLSEVTAGEVLAALDWHRTEAGRPDAEAEKARAVVDEIMQRGGRSEMDRETMRASIDALYIALYGEEAKK